MKVIAQKTITEEIEIPIPSYWKQGSRYFAALNSDPESNILCVHVFGSENPCATIMLILSSSVLGDIASSIQIDRDEFDKAFKEAKEIQEKYFTTV